VTRHRFQKIVKPQSTFFAQFREFHSSSWQNPTFPTTFFPTTPCTKDIRTWREFIVRIICGGTWCIIMAVAMPTLRTPRVHGSKRLRKWTIRRYGWMDIPFQLLHTLDVQRAECMGQKFLGTDRWFAVPGLRTRQNGASSFTNGWMLSFPRCAQVADPLYVIASSMEETIPFRGRIYWVQSHTQFSPSTLIISAILCLRAVFRLIFIGNE